MKKLNPVLKSDALGLYAGNQAALARALGVTRQRINKMEDGPIPERLALRLRFLVRPEAFDALGNLKKHN